MAKEMKVFAAEFTVTFSHTLIAENPAYARQKLEYLWEHASQSEKLTLIRASDIDAVVFGDARFRGEAIIAGKEPAARRLYGTRHNGYPDATPAPAR